MERLHEGENSFRKNELTQPGCLWGQSYLVECYSFYFSIMNIPMQPPPKEDIMATEHFLVEIDTPLFFALKMWGNHMTIIH